MCVRERKRVFIKTLSIEVPPYYASLICRTKRGYSEASIEIYYPGKSYAEILEVTSMCTLMERRNMLRDKYFRGLQES